MIHAMLLAAGLGTRLRPVTDSLPKPAVPFLNVPLLNWSVELLRDGEIAKWTINTHHLHDILLPLIQRTGQAIKNAFAISHEQNHNRNSPRVTKTAATFNLYTNIPIGIAMNCKLKNWKNALSLSMQGNFGMRFRFSDKETYTSNLAGGALGLKYSF